MRKAEFLQPQLTLFVKKRRVTAVPDAFRRRWEGITPKITASFAGTVSISLDVEKLELLPHHWNDL